MGDITVIERYVSCGFHDVEFVSVSFDALNSRERKWMIGDITIIERCVCRVVSTKMNFSRCRLAVLTGLTEMMDREIFVIECMWRGVSTKRNLSRCHLTVLTCLKGN